MIALVFLMKAKTCPRCKQYYVDSEKHFFKDKTKKDGLASACKKCKRKDYEYYKSLEPIKLKDVVCAFDGCKKTFTQTYALQKFCCDYCRDRESKFKNGKQNYYDKKNFKRRFDTKKELEKTKSNGKKWTEKQINTLLKMRFEQKSFKEIALSIGKTSNSCSVKYYIFTKQNGIPRIKIGE